jgi:death-on-curing protein
MRFLSMPELLWLHDQTIRTHGGTAGIREAAALESALSAARNRRLYEDAGLVQCAATYAFHLSQAHAFLDGNKRIAALATELFLALNDIKLRATNDEIANLFLGIAASEISRDQIEHQLTEWATIQT